MAFPTTTFTAANLVKYIPSVWGKRMNNFFKEKLVLGDFFTNRSSELSEGGGTLITPGMTAMTANAKSNATGVTLNSATESSINLVVDQWYEVSFAIEDAQAAQVLKSYELQKTYAKNAAFTIAQKLEVALAALFSGFSGSVGASNTNLADSEIRAAIALLDTNKVPGLYDGEVAFFMHPNTFWKQVQNIDKFSLAINSPINDPTAKKPNGSLYGIPVFTTPNCPNVSGTSGRYNVLAHKDAIHWASASLPIMTYGSGYVGQYGLRVQSSYIPDYLSTVTTADILYGCIENRNEAGVMVLSNS
jgi:hypothetical protein